MVSFIAASSATNFIVCNQPISYLSSNRCLNLVSAIIPPKRDNPLQFKRKELKQKKKKNQFLIEFSGFCGVVRMCKNWGGECDPNLELQVLEFMKNSKNPQKFPTKNELISAGRMDLVDEIMNKGGWMRVGWEDEVSEDDGLENDMELFLEKYGQNGCKSEVKSRSDQIQERCFEGSSFLDNSSSTASSSGRSLEVAVEDESGIGGILNRLERQRNLNLGLKLGSNGTTLDYLDDEYSDKNQNNATMKVVDSCHPQRSEPASTNHDRPMINGNGVSKSNSDENSSSSKLDAWRTWSVHRAGASDLTEFEAGEIDFGKNNRGIVDKSMGEIVAVTSKVRGALNHARDSDTYYRDITQGDIKTRLQHLQVELSSVLHSLKSNTGDISGKAKEHLSEDLRQLSDVSEFQENEMMNAQDKLRTLRAKLAVLEGKMSLAILDAQHILDEKQKRINDARTALQLLRTTCIVWPNSGSEVLLAGSFDGWATQRKMTRSSSGIFSLCLKLYPGKYEIKFIVDGVWRVDPLRPIVNNNGFENNLLTIA